MAFGSLLSEKVSLLKKCIAHNFPPKDKGRLFAALLHSHSER
jgi:hypothetical protein